MSDNALFGCILFLGIFALAGLGIAMRLLVRVVKKDLDQPTNEARVFSTMLKPELCAKLRAYATKKNVSELEVMRRFMMLGLLIADYDLECDKVTVIIRQHKANGEKVDQELTLD